MHEQTAEITTNHRNSLFIVNNRIYRHKILRINYTTYDVRQDQDSINPHTRSDIMVLANDEDNTHHTGMLASLGFSMPMHSTMTLNRMTLYRSHFGLISFGFVGTVLTPSESQQVDSR